MSVHLAHGLYVSSDVDLHLPAVQSASVDVSIRLAGSRQVPDDPAPGEVLAHLSDESDRPLYTFSRHADGVTLRFHRLCDFDIDSSLSRVTCTTAPGTDLDYVSVLTNGMLMTVLLVLRGTPVLHGSAVAREDRAVAFVGASGMGKSTLATLLCAAGASLLSDDVLRVDLEGGRPVCRSGSSENRLRKPELAGPAARRTADGRDAVAATRLAPDRVPLAAVAVPYPSRDGSGVRAEWLAPTDALLELLRFPRIVGWTEPVSTQRHFEHLADLVTVVPVARLRVPWGPPFAPELAAHVWRQLLAAPQCPSRPEDRATGAPSR